MWRETAAKLGMKCKTKTQPEIQHDVSAETHPFPQWGIHPSLLSKSLSPRGGMTLSTSIHPGCTCSISSGCRKYSSWFQLPHTLPFKTSYKNCHIKRMIFMNRSFFCPFFCFLPPNPICLMFSDIRHEKLSKSKARPLKQDQPQGWTPPAMLGWSPLPSRHQKCPLTFENKQASSSNRTWSRSSAKLTCGLQFSR